MSEAGREGPGADLEAVCTVCGTALPVAALHRPGRACGHCGATPQGIALAAAVLLVAGRGIEPFLNRLAFEEPARSARVLDLSGDAALAGVLWVIDGHRRGTLLEDVPQDHPHADLPRVDLLDRSAEPVDVLILRDALFHARDLEETLAAIARRLAPGGWAIVQDPFDWPLPAETEAVAARSGEAPPTRAVAGGRRLPVRHRIGADVVDRLARHGLSATFLRPALALDVLYRDAILIARRPPSGAGVHRA